MWAILWTLWGYKVMADLNILPLFPSKKQRLVVPSSDIFNDGLSLKLNSSPSLLYANTKTFILLLSLFFPYCLTSFPALCLFLLFYNVPFSSLLCLFKDREKWEPPHTLCMWFHKYYTGTWLFGLHFSSTESQVGSVNTDQFRLSNGGKKGRQQ